MCSSSLLWFISWHPLNSVTGWFFDSVEFNMDIAMLQFLQLRWFSATANVRFSFIFFQINITQLGASANFFCCRDIYWYWQFFFTPFFLLSPAYIPQAFLYSSVCLEFSPLSRVLWKYGWCLNTVFSKQGISIVTRIRIRSGDVRGRVVNQREGVVQ